MIRYFIFILFGLISCNGRISSEDNNVEIEATTQEELLQISKNEFRDSLYSIIGVDNLQDIVLKEENTDLELVRLLQFSFAFGKNHIQLVELQKQGDKILLRSHKFLFNSSCNTPLVGFLDGLEFTRKCFELKKSESRKLKTVEWEEVKGLILDTGFFYTTYNQNTKNICDGHSYSLEYIYPFQLRSKILKLERSCPDNKTAIYLIANAMIKLSNKK